MSARRIAAAIAAGLALSLAAVASFALTPAQVPNPRAARGSWVADVSNILSPDAERSLDAISAGLRQANGAEIAVVTVPATDPRTPKQFATELFNLWGVGDRERDNGVLMLIVTQAHRVEVETGYGAESVLPDSKVGRILDTYVVPRYREGDWDGGTVAGARALALALTPPDSTAAASDSAAGAMAPVEEPWPTVSTGDLVVPAAPSGFSGQPLMLLLGLLLAVVLIGGALVRGWYLDTFRWCPQCRRRMRKLTSDQESAYLTTDENFEESLRSMNHVVWRCDDCQRSEIDHHVRWFSGYGRCPKCERRTLKTTYHTLVAATYEHSGSREVIRTCKLSKCGFRDTRREVIAQLQHSSSSSGGGSSGGGGGGSFGGGSSGGGGAGRGW